MGLGKDYEGQNCSLARTLELVGERWTLLIVRDAFYGISRYSDFVTHLGVPRAVLSERLHALTAAGILEKRRYQASPPREEYVLTEVGQELWPAVHALSTFGGRHLSPGGPCKAFFHTTCGTELGTASICPTCGIMVEPADIEMRVGPGDRPSDDDNPVSAGLRASRRLLAPFAL